VIFVCNHHPTASHSVDALEGAFARQRQVEFACFEEDLCFALCGIPAIIVGATIAGVFNDNNCYVSFVVVAAIWEAVEATGANGDSIAS